MGLQGLGQYMGLQDLGQYMGLQGLVSIWDCKD